MWSSNQSEKEQDELIKNQKKSQKTQETFLKSLKEQNQKNGEEMNMINVDFFEEYQYNQEDED